MDRAQAAAAAAVCLKSTCATETTMRRPEDRRLRRRRSQRQPLPSWAKLRPQARQLGTRTADGGYCSKSRRRMRMDTTICKYSAGNAYLYTPIRFTSFFEKVRDREPNTRRGIGTHREALDRRGGTARNRILRVHRRRRRSIPGRLRRR